MVKFNHLKHGKKSNGTEVFVGKMDVKEKLPESSFYGVGKQKTDSGGLRGEWGCENRLVF